MPNPNCMCFAHADRSKDSCETCAYGACPGCTYPNELYCLRRAPVRVEDSSYGKWPMVARDSWCGEYQRADAVKFKGWADA